MDEIAANTLGADRRVGVFGVYADAVLDLLDGKYIDGIDGTIVRTVDGLCDEIIYEYNGIRIASDVDGVRSVACSHPRHGSGSAFARLAQRISELYVKTDTSGEMCPICKNTGWLPITSHEAHQQYTMMRAVGWFRGIEIPQLKAQLQQRRTDGPATKHSVSAVRAAGDDPVPSE